MNDLHKKSSEKVSKQQMKTKGMSKSLGPVPALEDYVHPEWWRRIFNSLYLKTDADVVEDSKITRQEADTFINILKLGSEDTILDLCCGQGRHVLELARRGFKIEGLDRSRYLIQRAKAFAKKESLSVRFREGDARKLPYPPKKSYIYPICEN